MNEPCNGCAVLIGARMTRTDIIRNRDGEAAVEPYRKLMRAAYRGAVLKRGKRHPYRRAHIEGYLEFKR